MHPIPAALDPTPLPIPLFGRHVPAGFPSPADDFLEGEIDLAAYLIERPAATFFLRVSGRSMSGAGIMDGDLVIVDRSKEAKPGRVVVAVHHGEMTIKRLCRLPDGRLALRAEHPDFAPVVLDAEDPAEVWGVVVGVVRKMA